MWTPRLLPLLASKFDQEARFKYSETTFHLSLLVVSLAGTRSAFSFAGSLLAVSAAIFFLVADARGNEAENWDDGHLEEEAERHEDYEVGVMRNKRKLGGRKDPKQDDAQDRCDKQLLRILGSHGTKLLPKKCSSFLKRRLNDLDRRSRRRRGGHPGRGVCE